MFYEILYVPYSIKLFLFYLAIPSVLRQLPTYGELFICIEPEGGLRASLAIDGAVFIAVAPLCALSSNDGVVFIQSFGRSPLVIKFTFYPINVIRTLPEGFCFAFVLSFRLSPAVSLYPITFIPYVHFLCDFSNIQAFFSGTVRQFAPSDEHRQLKS